MQLKDYKFKLSVDAYKKKKGQEISVSDIMSEDDTWLFERKNNKTNQTFTSVIIKHYKVQELKRLAGLQIAKEPELIVSPTIDNGMTAVWIGAMRLPYKRAKTDTVVGESNKETSKIPYIVTIAHKRWYDRAVLDCLEMYEAYSDLETPEFDKEYESNDIPELTDLSDQEVKVIQPFVQSINDAKDSISLDLVVKSLKKQVKSSGASENSIKVLNSLYTRKKGEFLDEKF